jgi:hypothetical protein
MPSTKPKICGVVPGRKFVACGSAPPSYVSPVPVHASLWISSLPNEIFIMIAAAVYHTLGSAGLVALAGVCSKWRRLVMAAGMPLAESRRLFSAMNTSNAVLASPNFFRSRLFDNAGPLVLNSEIHHEFFPEGVWPPASIRPKAFATGLIQVFGNALAFARAYPSSVKAARGQHVGGLWAARDINLVYGDNYRLELASPFFDRPFAIFDREHAKTVAGMVVRPRIFEDPERANRETGVAEFVVQAPVPLGAERGKPSAEKFAAISISIHEYGFRPLPDPGPFPAGTLVGVARYSFDGAVGTHLSVSMTPVGTLLHAKNREAGAVALFRAGEDCTAEDVVRFERWRRGHMRSWSHGRRWVVDRMPISVTARVFCAVPLCTFYESNYGAVEDRATGHRLADICEVGLRAFEFGRRPCVDEDGTESDASVAPDGRKHRLSAAAVDAIVPANLFRSSGDRNFRGFTWNSREMMPAWIKTMWTLDRAYGRWIEWHQGQAPEATASFTDWFLKQFWYSRRMPTRIDGNVPVPGLVLCMQAWVAWSRGQERATAAVFGDNGYKSMSATTLIGPGNNPVRNGRMGSGLDNSHRANAAVYFDPGVAGTLQNLAQPNSPWQITPGLLLNSVVGGLPSTFDTVVPDFEARSHDWTRRFPVWRVFDQSPLGDTTRRVADLARRMVGTTGMMHRLPLVLLDPEAVSGTEGRGVQVHRCNPAGIRAGIRTGIRAGIRAGTAGTRAGIRAGTAGIRASAEPLGPGIRVEPAGEPEPEPEPEPTETPERIPGIIRGKNQSGETAYSISVHFASSETTVLFGTIKRNQLVAACTELPYVFPPEIWASDAHSMTTWGITMVVLDSVTAKLLEEGFPDRLTPGLVAVLAHVAPLLTLPDNNTEWSKRYRSACASATRKYVDTQQGPDDPFSTGRAEHIPRAAYRHPHPLESVSPVERKAMKLGEVAPNLDEFIRAVYDTVVWTDPADHPRGWLWDLCRSFLERVLDAFNRWAVNPDVYHRRLCRLAAHAERGFLGE